MKSVGEAMALGRTFPEALNKAIQSLEIGVDALDASGPSRELIADPETFATLTIPRADRLFRVYRAIQQGMSLDEIANATGYDLWFLGQMQEMQNAEGRIKNAEGKMQKAELKALLREAKQMGFADSHIARLLNSSFLIHHSSFRELRKSLNILPTFQRVDTPTRIR